MGLQAKFLLVGIFVFLYFVSINEAQGPPVKYFMGKINGKPLRDHYANQALGLDADYDCGVSSTEASKWNVTINQWIDQPLDHFDPSINVTWKMRYEYKSQYFQKRNDSDIVFLLIGGEGSIPNNWICFTNYTWTQLAIDNQAFMFQTEHRYFGQSRPTANMTTENLKWLTMEQALADLNNFIIQMNNKFNFTNPRWVAFGGSYPGTMAANLRKYYPNITVGNVASSAPLWAKVDFWEYAAKMEEAIYWENKTCGDNIKTAFAMLKQMTFTNRSLLNTKFGIVPPLCDNCSTIDFDSTNFLSTLFNTFQGIIQYTFDARNNETLDKNGMSVANLCTKMNDPTVPDLIDRIVNVYNWVYSWDYELDAPPTNTVLYNNYTAMLAPTVNVSFDSDGDGRGWMWLCCNEFGWLQTTDNGYGIFKDLIPLNYYLQMCTDLFGVNNSFVQSQVSASLNRFGLPSNFNATNVILPNGSLDPWSTLGCNVTRNDTHQIPVTTPGGAHCVDMYPYNSIEPSAVNYTVHLVRQEVMYYLNQTPSNDVSPPTSPTSPTSPASPNSSASSNSPTSPTSPASSNSSASPTSPPSQPQGASMTSVSLATFLLGLIITIKCC